MTIVRLGDLQVSGYDLFVEIHRNEDWTDEDKSERAEYLAELVKDYIGRLERENAKLKWEAFKA
jgi:predicted LPLAT superfamily acyltransferase